MLSFQSRAELVARRSIEDNRWIVGQVPAAASRCIDEQRLAITAATVSFMDMAANIYGYLQLLDDPHQLTAATVRAPLAEVNVAVGGAVRNEDISFSRRYVSMGLKAESEPRLLLLSLLLLLLFQKYSNGKKVV